MQKLKCAACGFEGDPAAFGKRWALPRPQDVCQQCLHGSLRRQLTRSPWLTVGWFVLPLLLGAALVEVDKGGALAHILLCVGISQALMYPLIALHEVGHALAARAVGFEVVQVVIGLGRRLWAGSVRGVHVVVNAVPVLGVTMAGTLDRTHLRRRFFAYILGGPAVNFVLLVAGLAIAGATPLHGTSPYWLCFIWVFAVLNGIVLVANLLPHRLAHSGMASDGLRLLQTPLASPATQTEWVVGYALAHWMRCRDLRDHAGALHWSAKGLEIDPGSFGASTLRAITLLETDPAAAREGFKALLSRPGLKPLEKAAMKNNVAFATVLANDPAHLAEADALSQEALEAVPWQPSFQNTRAAVLVALDRAAEAVPLLKEAFENEFDRFNRATIACVMAMALAKMGEHPQAREWLGRSRAIDAACSLLPRAAAQVQPS